MADYFNTQATLIARVMNQYDDKSWSEFDEIYRKYIVAVIISMGVSYNDADDLAQKILLTLWKKLPKFDYQPGKCKFRTFMTKITRDLVYNFFRDSNRYSKKLENSKEENQLSHEEPDIYSIAERKWKVHIYNMAMDNIKRSFSETSIQCFEMFNEGCSMEEISKKLNMKPNTCYVQRKRVLERLNREIRHLNDDLS